MNRNRIWRGIAFLAFALLNLIYVNGQTQFPGSRDLLIHIPTASSKDCVEIASLFSSIEGVTYMGYCDNLQIFVLRVDNAKHPDDRQSLLLLQNFPRLWYIKEGGNYEQIVGNCERFAEPEPSSTNIQN